MQTSFESLLLKSELITGLNAQNITNPTAVQALTYPAFLEGKDLIVESHTGSGKTLAFLLPLFTKIKLDEKANQALILAPTHELTHQIHEQIKLLAKNSGLPITSTILMGEMSMEKQIERLKSKPQILVGSPGRILDLIMKKKINVDTLETVILDEADNLLESSQGATVKKLLHQIGHKVQVTLFSASMNKHVQELAAPFVSKPQILQTATKTELNPRLSHLYLKTDVRDKFENLKKLLQTTNTQKALVFVSQHTDTKVLVEKLNYHGFTVATISGKLSKEERKNALAQFKSGKVKVLLSSDLAARGLDVANISHIFHYDLALTPQDYLHRAGRSARNGKEGTSISLITPKDLGMIRVLERTFGIKLQEITLIKGRIKNLAANSFLEPMETIEIVTETPSKKRNKYPKGFTSDSGKKGKKNKKDAANSSHKSIKENNTPQETSRKKTVASNKLTNEKIGSKKFAARKQNTLANEDAFLSGSLADALKLIEEAGWDE